MPLHQDRTFLQQDQSRIGADDRFQKDIIGHKKRILGTGIIAPCSDSISGRTQAVLQGVIVYVINLVETLIIRILQTGSDQKEKTFRVVQQLISHVCVILIIDMKCGNGGNVSLFDQLGLWIHESPRTIIGRGVLQRKFFLYAILLVNKRIRIFILGRTFRYRHQGRDIRTQLIGTEIQDRQMIIIPVSETDSEDICPQGHEPVDMVGIAL